MGMRWKNMKHKRRKKASQHTIIGKNTAKILIMFKIAMMVSTFSFTDFWWHSFCINMSQTLTPENMNPPHNFIKMVFKNRNKVCIGYVLIGNCQNIFPLKLNKIILTNAKRCLNALPKCVFGTDVNWKMQFREFSTCITLICCTTTMM